MKPLLSFALLVGTLLSPSILIAEEPSRPELLQSFNPAEGFKPAQRDLTEIFLQIAGSLEATGSPEPYLRHIALEHNRIAALYRQKTGKALRSLRPDYITDAYIDRLSANWNLLSPKIGLQDYAKEFGHDMRNAIQGTRGTGTVVVDIFNRHQQSVFRAMTGKEITSPNFEALKQELVQQLELDKPSADDGRYEVARRDAISPARGIQETTAKLFRKLDQGLNPDAADAIKSVLRSIILDTGMMAQSELEAGIAEWAIQSRPSNGVQTKAEAPYNAENETQLSPPEKKAFAALLSKSRFTKGDFAAMETFYATAYDRLSESGKDELSRRIWAGKR